MGAFLLRRLLWMVPTLIGITLVTFLAVHAAPGELGARDVDVENSASSGGGDARALFRAEHLLDAPLWKQYLHFLGPFDLSPRGSAHFGGSGADPLHGLLALDLGTEFQRPGVPVLPEIGARLAVTGPLALLAAFLLFALGVPLGVATALRADGLADRVTRAFLLALYSLPGYWLGLLFVLGFGAGGFALLPVLGLSSQHELEGFDFVVDRALHLVLPLATLSLPGLAYVARQTRAAVLELFEQDFVRAARARGLSERDVIVKHVVRNALPQIATLFGSILPALLGGSVVVESLFGLPGLGLYAYEGMSARDLNVILGVTTVTACITLVSILAADVFCAWLDPRLREGERT